jgi:hypothetical protein
MDNTRCCSHPEQSKPELVETPNKNQNDECWEKLDDNRRERQKATGFGAIGLQEISPCTGMP